MQITYACFLLLAACAADYGCHRIPNGIIAAGILCGLGSRVQEMGIWGIAAYMSGMIIPFVLTYPLFKFGMLGAGDVKLFAVTAGYLPLFSGAKWMACTFLMAAAASFLKLIYLGRLKERTVYFMSYVWESICEGKRKLYMEEQDGRKDMNLYICMSGHMLGALLLHVGGMY